MSGSGDEEAVMRGRCGDRGLTPAFGAPLSSGEVLPDERGSSARRAAMLAWLIACAIAAPAWAEETPAPAKVEAKRALRPAEAFPKELPGSGWFAICKDPEWFRVVAVPETRTHDALGAEGCPKPLFFVKGLALRDGHRIELPFEVGRGEERALVVGRDAWFVRGARPEGRCTTVELATSKRTQLLWSPTPLPRKDGNPDCPEFCLNRVWAGDLDGDERPDFLVRTAERDRRAVLRLYLSSLAEGDALVGEFASADTTPGCR